VTDLVARQQGDAVVLSFTLPTKSTEQKPLTMLPAVDVYRTAAAAPPTTPGAAPPKLTPHLSETIPSDAIKTYEKNGRVELSDPLEAAELARTPGQPTTFLVRTRVSGKRASADSNAVTVPLFPAPPPVGDLHAMVAVDAITLAWTAPPRNATPSVVGYRVYRTEIPSPAGNAATAPPGTNSSVPSPPELLGQPTQPEYRDTTVELDHAYSYSVRSVAQFGSAAVESADSAPLAVFAKDMFPPAAPQGLETVIVPETNGVPAYVEVAWNISPEADLAGYNVYRSEQSDNTGTRLNGDELLPAPTFRDMMVAPARHYFYRVAAVDRDGNVSPLSPAVEADVP
jgi:hypothetical protein